MKQLIMATKEATVLNTIIIKKG